MTHSRTHEVTTDDAVTIRATVEGSGPSLVLLQGVMGDGDLDWRSLLPHLTDCFTCHLPSMRGRGRSDTHPNLRIDRVGRDYATYVESLGEPTRLVGWSAGAGHALSLSARLDAVVATALYEPLVSSLMDQDERQDLMQALAQGQALVQDGDLAGAMRAFAAHPFTQADLAAADDVGYFEAAGAYSPHVLEVFRQVSTYDGPRPEDPETLGAITSPLLVLHGAETGPFFTQCARHVVAHLAVARIHAVPGAGHAGPLTHPRAVAEELRGFFDAVDARG
ncbi:alpha/beta fold hydrolase [Serinicoccus kebangsaanensis]|uniref:alpha/beta fold hydrolase n=1 Tax=Serinicoccus kebangsaanensis TaxID=2602069 RepID=UPI00124D7FDE|nr:alpha/beta hydrolase [Serinicoccus kebangsaanensis]